MFEWQQKHTPLTDVQTKQRTRQIDYDNRQQRLRQLRRRQSADRVTLR